MEDVGMMNLAWGKWDWKGDAGGRVSPQPMELMLMGWLSSGGPNLSAVELRPWSRMMVCVCVDWEGMVRGGG
jgi:hypothetical protein